ncbi:MAG: antitoxin [Sulfurimonas sp.]|nr:MAG: antitoxin [Sulfurimonas sp.]
MQAILSNYTASITELKKSPTQLLKNAGDEVIAILNHNVADAYLIPAKTYEAMVEMLDDYMLSQEIKQRLDEDFTPVEVKLDEL